MDHMKARALHYYLTKIQALARGFLARQRFLHVVEEFRMIEDCIESEIQIKKTAVDANLAAGGANAISLSASNKTKTAKEEMLICRDKLNALMAEEKYLESKIASVTAVVFSRTLQCGSGEYNML
jgi:myosin heavy subunit